MITNWYKDAVVYQIYPKSFCDSNGDGIGDFNGIISKLDYLKELGINTVWISPCYPSPQKDNGYDISDYDDVGREYGTMEDFKRMADEMHRRGIKLLMDLVVKSSSDEHFWFTESMKGKDNPYRDYYVWKDPVDGREPNDWQAGYQISAWTFDEKSGQYWLHTFIEGEPDLNWDNPKVRQEIYAMVNRWLDIGVDGFRCDVINLIAKDYDSDHIGDGKHLHEYLHELHENCLAPHDAMTVGEVYDLTPDEAFEMVAPDRGELSLVFQFEHLREGRIDGQRFFMTDFNAKNFVDTLAKWQYGFMGRAWNTLVMENHDQPRCIDRFGSVEYRKESAKMLATLLYCLQGTVFIYEGQEFGSINPVFRSLEECDDCETKQIQDHLVELWGTEGALKAISLDSRDCARVPVAWDGSETGGFSDGKAWIKYNDFRHEVNAASDLADENGVYRFYQKLLSLRKSKRALSRGNFELIRNDEDGGVVYRRYIEGERDIFVVLNYSDKENAFDFSSYKGELLLSGYGDIPDVMRPFECLVFEK